MSLRTFNLTVDVTDQQLIRYYNYKHPLTGFIEVSGSFGGGILSFDISISDGVVKNPWNDCNGNHLMFSEAETVEFTLPVINRNGAGAIIYATLDGATSPDITINILDNTG